MSKKDYELIASVLNRFWREKAHSERTLNLLSTMSITFSDALAEDNPRFDKQRFISAVCALS